jgi:hypothetical protein
MKVKIIELFEAYESQVNETTDVGDVFYKSGMVNRFKELDYGFFPIGSGILTEKCKVEEAEIEEHGIMVLGNDFGTCEYLSTKCENKRENEKNSTIKNLQQIISNNDRTFYTNFFLGLRIGGAMIKRIVPLEDEYKAFCYKFFLTQLNKINPSIVICLGNDVRFILYEFFKDQFPDFKSKSITYKNLYESVDKKYEVTTKKESELGERKFVFIPHPSYAHVNWTPDIRTKIELAVK